MLGRRTFVCVTVKRRWVCSTDVFQRLSWRFVLTFKRFILAAYNHSLDQTSVTNDFMFAYVHLHQCFISHRPTDVTFIKKWKEKRKVSHAFSSVFPCLTRFAYIFKWIRGTFNDVLEHFSSENGSLRNSSNGECIIKARLDVFINLWLFSRPFFFFGNRQEGG